MARPFKLLSIMGWQWVLEKMLALCSAQADVVCAVGVGGQEEDPPLLGWWWCFALPVLGDGPQTLMHAKQMLDHRTVSLEVVLNCSCTRRLPCMKLHETGRVF